MARFFDRTRNDYFFQSRGDVISCGVVAVAVVISLRAGSEGGRGSRSENITEKLLFARRTELVARERKSDFLKRGEVGESAEFDFGYVFADYKLFDKGKAVYGARRDFVYVFGNGYRFNGVFIVFLAVGSVLCESFRKFRILFV